MRGKANAFPRFWRLWVGLGFIASLDAQHDRTGSLALLEIAVGRSGIFQWIRCRDVEAQIAVDNSLDDRLGTHLELAFLGCPCADGRPGEEDRPMLVQQLRVDRLNWARGSAEERDGATGAYCFE